MSPHVPCLYELHRRALPASPALLTLQRRLPAAGLLEIGPLCGWADGQTRASVPLADGRSSCPRFQPHPLASLPSTPPSARFSKFYFHYFDSPSWGRPEGCPWRLGGRSTQQSVPVPNWTEAESESVEGLSGLGMPPLVRGSDDVAYSAIRGWSGSGRSLGRRAEPGCGLRTIPLYPSTNHPQLGRTALIPAARVTGRHFPTLQAARRLSPESGLLGELGW